VADLKRIAGDPKDEKVPDDPKPVIQEYAKAANKLANWLVQESGRVDAYVKANPSLRQNPKWVVQVPQGPFMMQVGLNTLLSQSAQSVAGIGQQLRQVLQDNSAKDEQQNIVRQIRTVSVAIDDQLGEWTKGITAFLDDAGKIKTDSKEMQFLARGSSGQLFKPVLDKVNDIAKKITELPALKIDDIAKRLQQENVVVIENDKDVRVVTFDEMWPVADPQAGQFGGKDEDGQRRVFAGDGAITNAILSMQVEKPFATVILVAYEPPQNPQMRQMMRPQPPAIPIEQLS
jgi:hypothetical protein